MEHKSFTKKDSQILKGIAIIAMLWHHSFLTGRFEDFPVSTWPLSAVSVSYIAFFFKFCVSIFAFISGYGLYKSYVSSDTKSARSILSWCRERYMKTFKGYWIIVVLLWVVGCTIGTLTRTTYFDSFSFSGILQGLFYMMLDLLGLSKFFGAPSLIGTWWYMSAAIVFIFLTPILFQALENFGAFLTIAFLFILPRIGTGYPGSIAFYSFVPMFFVGMCFSKYDVFSCVDRAVKKPINRAILIVGGVLLTIICYHLVIQLPIESFWDIEWSIFPIIYIVLFYVTLVRIPVVNRVFEFFGRHSANMYLIHNFFRTNYSRYIYSGNFLFVLFKLLAASLMFSMCLELGKRLIRYDSLLDKFFEKIENRAIRERNLGR